jgi:hypothetical protein
MYRHEPVNSVPAILLITGNRVDADADVSVLTNDDDAVAFSLSATSSSWDDRQCRVVAAGMIGGCGAKPSPKEEQQQMMMMHKRADRCECSIRELMITMLLMFGVGGE